MTESWRGFVLGIPGPALQKPPYPAGRAASRPHWFCLSVHSDHSLHHVGRPWQHNKTRRGSFVKIYQADDFRGRYLPFRLPGFTGGRYLSCGIKVPVKASRRMRSIQLSAEYDVGSIDFTMFHSRLSQVPRFGRQTNQFGNWVSPDEPPWGRLTDCSPVLLQAFCSLLCTWTLYIIYIAYIYVCVISVPLTYRRNNENIMFMSGITA